MATEFNSVWDALEEDPVRQENLKLRSQLMIEINAVLDQKQLTQADIAKLLATTQPRVSALKKGKINNFRLDMLVDFATRLGLSISINIAA
ncbi:MAG: XRE family transcriptional regulator [Proteobacteria bacterium]|nr:MAG: XRE family transcriptional regulator [Pseudomonadota bacterium]